MCRADEQNASVFGHKGKPASTTIQVMSDNAPPRKVADTPTERLADLMREASALTEGQDAYLTKMTSPPSEACKALGLATETAPWGELHASGQTMFRFSSAWTTDNVEAKTLAMFAYMLKARRVLEVGMFTGFGALSIAEVLPSDGKMISCEIDPFLATFSKPFFAKSPHGQKVDVRIGAALETMRAYDAVAEGGGCDMIFIDADKGGYADYYEAALTTPGLLADGGVIVVDNTLFKGQAWMPPQDPARDHLSWNAGGVAIAEFNEMVRTDDRVEQVILPIRDGITIVRRKGGVDSAFRRPAPAVSAAAETTPKEQEAAAPAVQSKLSIDAVDPTIAKATTNVVDVSDASADAVITGVGGKNILERMRLDGKVALVTGGGQGIGRAFAHALCEAGASVMVVDLDLARAETVAAELSAKGGMAIAHKANVADEASVAAMVAAAIDRLGGLHIAVNNAGINKNSAAEDTPMDEFDATFNVNTRGVFMCCQHEARHMLKNGGGKIINTASMASLIVPHPQKQAAYNASKSAVVKLTQSLACEWADRGVNVNCMSPGIVDTPLIWENPALKPLAEKWIGDMPIGRLCNVTDLQAAIVYLASEASDYMVGHNLVIEGGQSLW